jgi:hypothetical protein
VESVVLPVVACSLLLQAVTENKSRPSKGAPKVRAEIMFVVF